MDEFQEAFIKRAWIWESSETTKVAAQLSAHGITLDDVQTFLGLTSEEMKQKLLEHPEIKMAYDTGPSFLEYKIKSKVYETALNGNLDAAKTIFNMNKTQRSEQQFELAQILDEIESANDTVEMSLTMRKMIYKRAAQAVASGEVKGSELIRLMAMVSDRTDGKVAEKIEHSGNLTLAGILESVSGKTAGLPDPKWFDQPLDVDYTNITDTVALNATVVDGDGILKSEEDKNERL